MLHITRAMSIIILIDITITTVVVTSVVTYFCGPGRVTTAPRLANGGLRDINDVGASRVLTKNALTPAKFQRVEVPF